MNFSFGEINDSFIFRARSYFYSTTFPRGSSLEENSPTFRGSQKCQISQEETEIRNREKRLLKKLFDYNSLLQINEEKDFSVGDYLIEKSCLSERNFRKEFRYFLVLNNFFREELPPRDINKSKKVLLKEKFFSILPKSGLSVFYLTMILCFFCVLKVVFS